MSSRRAEAQGQDTTSSLGPWNPKADDCIVKKLLVLTATHWLISLLSRIWTKIRKEFCFVWTEWCRSVAAERVKCDSGFSRLWGWAMFGRGWCLVMLLLLWGKDILIKFCLMWQSDLNCRLSLKFSGRPHHTHTGASVPYFLDYKTHLTFNFLMNLAL